LSFFVPIFCPILVVIYSPPPPSVERSMSETYIERSSSSWAKTDTCSELLLSGKIFFLCDGCCLGAIFLLVPPSLSNSRMGAAAVLRTPPHATDMFHKHGEFSIAPEAIDFSFSRETREIFISVLIRTVFFPFLISFASAVAGSWRNTPLFGRAPVALF